MDTFLCPAPHPETRAPGEGAVLDLSDGNPTILQPGMVFHIPQPYRVAGEQTVGASETVLVTESGREVVTHFPRELFRK